MSLWMQPQLISQDRSRRIEKSVKLLEELEAGIEKQKQDIRLYSPRVPIIGISHSYSNSTNGMFLTEKDNGDRRVDDDHSDHVQHTNDNDDDDEILDSDLGNEEAEDGEYRSDDSTEIIEDNLRMDDSEDES